MMRRLSTRAWVVLMIALGLVATASGAGLVLSLHAGSRAQPAAAAASPGPQPGSTQARADLTRMQSLLNSGSASKQAALLVPGVKFVSGTGPLFGAGTKVTIRQGTFRSSGRPGTVTADLSTGAQVTLDLYSTQGHWYLYKVQAGAQTSARITGRPGAVSAQLMSDTVPSDTLRPNQVPTPDQIGLRTPVILVHGLGEQASTWTDGGTGSMFSRVDAINGVMTLMYDYSQANHEWVDNISNGPGLAFYIKHVAQASRDYRSPDGARGPGKVIVVAFSLGGLITRYAATTGGEAGDISKVITIGVPNTGSFWANLGGPVRDLICTEAGVHGPAAICNDQWQVLSGLQAFGPKIAALKPLPPSISLNAIAGDETWVYQIWGSFWGGIPLFGDGVVATGSALAKRPGGVNDTFDTVRNPIVPGDTSVMHIPLKHSLKVQELVVGYIDAWVRAHQPAPVAPALGGDAYWLAGGGQWYVHDAQLRISRGPSGLVGDENWNAGGAIITGHAQIAFTSNADGSLSGTFTTSTTYTYSEQPLPAGFLTPGPMDGPQQGQTFTLLPVAPMLAKSIPGSGGASVGNPYLCQAGLSPSLSRNCGA
jgi:pimeloyl-ACP methyl ester carboxylesterase